MSTFILKCDSKTEQIYGYLDIFYSIAVKIGFYFDACWVLFHKLKELALRLHYVNVTVNIGNWLPALLS